MKKVLKVMVLVFATGVVFGQNADVRQLRNSINTLNSRVTGNETAINNLNTAVTTNAASIVANASTGTTMQKGNGSGGFSASSISETNQTVAIGTNGTGVVVFNLRGGSGSAPTISSATTISPTNSIVFVSGTVNPVNTITAPAPIATMGGEITLIPTGIWTTGTGGNIALATTAVVNKALRMVYDPTTAKWYPSY